MNKGFTIIEVLVSLVILAAIAVISSNILQSAIDTEQKSTSQLNSIKELNLASSILRRDIRQIINVPSRDFFGESENGTFISNNNSNKFSFNTRISSLSNEISPIKKVDYVYEDNMLIRRQFYSSNPYNADDFNEYVLLKDISEMEMSFLYGNRWYRLWPIDVISSRKIPKLIRLEFKISGKEYSWLIEPNITYPFQG